MPREFPRKGEGGSKWGALLWSAVRVLLAAAAVVVSALTLFVGSLFIHEAWSTRFWPWKCSVQMIGTLAALCEVVRNAEGEDRDTDGQREYVGWRNYEAVVSASSYEQLRVWLGQGKYLTHVDVRLESIKKQFVLDTVEKRVEGYTLQTGEYVDVGVFPRFKLALFIPADPDRAERTWILVAWTREKTWFQTLRSFLIVKNGDSLEYYYGWNFPMTDSLPDIDRLGDFQGDVWKANLKLVAPGEPE
jgi:hypothetical protein